MATSIATLTSGQTGASSLIDINNNYAALNTGKAETSGQVFTGAISATNFSGSSTGTNTGDQTNITGNAETATFATTAGTVTTNANLTGEVTSLGNAATVTNSAVIGKVLTGYVSGIGTVTATDTILQAFNKTGGNIATKAGLGANSDITSLTGLTTALSVAQGGTGSTTRTFVDLTSTETIGGGKTFSSILTGVAGITITGAAAINVSGSAQTQIGNGSTGSVFIGSGNTTQTVSLGEAGTKTVTLGSLGATSSMLIQAGTNPVIQSTQQTATGAVQRISNTVDTIDTFITNTSPEGVIIASIGDKAIDGTNGLIYVKSSGAATNTGWVRTDGRIFSQTSSVTVGNTTTLTSIAGTGVGSLTLPANHLKVGSNIRISGNGFLSRASGTFLIQFLIGGIVQASTAVNIGNQTNGEFSFNSLSTIRTIGATGTVFSQGNASLINGSTLVVPTTATTVIDTTTTKLIDVKVQWGTANAGNTVTLTNLVVELI